jgi:hypothetical protein
MPNWKKVIVSGSDAILGTLVVSGAAAVGTSSLGPNENTITLGARDNASEGGQIGFNAPGGSYTSASFIDLYQNRLRILKGTNAGSTGEVANWSMHSLQMSLPAYTSVSSFPGTAVATLAVDSGGNVLTVASSGGGTVTSVATAGTVNGITLTGGTITTSGTITLGGSISGLTTSNLSSTAGITNSQLANSAITIGSTAISLGSSATTVAGLTSITSTAFTGSLQGTASFATSASFAATASYSNNLQISGSINNVNYIDFNTGNIIGTNAPAWKEGRLFYDSGSGALAMYNWEQDVTLNIGQEQWLRARNQTGVTITNGSVVKLVGAIGDRPTIALAQSTDQTNTFSIDNEVIGMATHDIEHGTDGFVTTFGIVNGLNTSAYSAGDILWVSQSAGKFTSTAPSAPYDKTFVGIVTRANPSNGSVFVTPLTPIHFHDISSVSASTYQQGDLWMYRSGSAGQANAWINTKQLSGSYGLTGSLAVNGPIYFASDAAGSNGLSIVRNGSNNWTWGTSGIGNVMTIVGNSITLPQPVTTNNGLNVTPGGNQTTLGLGVTVGSYPAANLARFSSGSVTVMNISGSGVYGTGSFNWVGAISASSFTGSLQGTASWANNVVGGIGVTSVATTGTVSGITLTGGTITSTGTITLGGSISGLTTSNLSGTAGITNGQLANSSISIAGSAISLGGSISQATILAGSGVFSGSAQIPNSSITNAQLANSSITVGSTAISLGSSATTIAGLTSVTSTAFTGSISGSTVQTSIITAAGNVTFGGAVKMGGISNAYKPHFLVYDTSTAVVSYTSASNVTVASASYAANGGVTQIVAGTNVTISPAGGTGVVTINATGGGGGGAGTVNSGNASYFAYYPTTGTTVDDNPNVSWNSGATRMEISGGSIQTDKDSKFNSISVGTGNTSSNAVDCLAVGYRSMLVPGNNTVTLGSYILDGSGTGTTATPNDSVIVGAYAVQKDHTQVDGTVAIGRSVMTSGSQVSSTVAIGTAAFESPDGGTVFANSVAIGYEAGKKVFNSSDTIAIGNQTLYGSAGVTQTVRDVFIGGAVGAQILDSARNISVGFRSFYNAQYAYGNTVVGTDAFGHSQTPIDSTIIGVDAANDADYTAPTTAIGAMSGIDIAGVPADGCLSITALGTSGVMTNNGNPIASAIFMPPQNKVAGNTTDFLIADIPPGVVGLFIDYFVVNHSTQTDVRSGTLTIVFDPAMQFGNMSEITSGDIGSTAPITFLLDVNNINPNLGYVQIKNTSSDFWDYRYQVRNISQH